ncbi:MAG TPA: hypothetical protein VMB52_06455 [Verrucomicrobiae bacterium]|nr:hypothetical protein [Verrucomicrobiae bacterium]
MTIEAGYTEAPAPIYDQTPRPTSPEAVVAMGVLEPCIRLTERVRGLLNVPFGRNNENRADTELPEGVITEAENERMIRYISRGDRPEVRRILTPHDEGALRGMAVDAGHGRRQDVTLQEVTLPSDALLICQGGRVDTKGMAQKSLALGDPIVGSGVLGDAEDVPTGDIVQCGSRNRKLVDKNGERRAVAALLEGLGPEERVRRERLLMDLDIDPTNLQTEYDGMIAMWVTDPEFVPESPRFVTMLDTKGRVENRFEGGELLSIGSIRGRRVYAQEVPRGDAFDEDGLIKYRDKAKYKVDYEQPNAAKIAATIARVLDKNAAAVVTGAAYLLEEIVEAAEVMYDMVRDNERGGPGVVAVRPVAYGADRMRAVTGSEPPEKGLGEILGSIGKAHRNAKAFIQKIAGHQLANLLMSA